MFAKTLMASLLSSTLLLTACSSTSGSGSAADPRLAQYDVETEGSSYGTACVVGAGIAGLGCLLIADQDQYAACVAAAAVGCGVAMGGNALLDNLRQQYHTREQQLNGLIATNEDLNKQALQVAKASQDVYKDEERKLQQMQKDIKANKVSREQILAQIRQNEANCEILQKNLDSYEQSLDSLKTARKGIVGEQKLSAAEKRRLKECDRQIAALQSTINDMRESLEGFVAQRNVLQVGLKQVGQAA